MQPDCITASECTCMHGHTWHCGRQRDDLCSALLLSAAAAAHVASAGWLLGRHHALQQHLLASRVARREPASLELLLLLAHHAAAARIAVCRCCLLVLMHSAALQATVSWCAHPYKHHSHDMFIPCSHSVYQQHGFKRTAASYQGPCRCPRLFWAGTTATKHLRCGLNTAVGMCCSGSAAHWRLLMYPGAAATHLRQ